MGVWQSGQMRGAVNPLPYGYSGSNPLAPTICYCLHNNKVPRLSLKYPIYLFL